MELPTSFCQAPDGVEICFRKGDESPTLSASVSLGLWKTAVRPV